MRKGVKYQCEPGERFGKLLIKATWTEEFNCTKKKKKQKVCECKCDCGNTVTLRASALRHDGKSDCGCIGRRGNRNLCKVGEKFGRLTIVKRWTAKKPTKSKQRETICECICDCGNTVITKGRYLRKKHKQSCGCLQRLNNNQHHAWKGHGEIGAAVWASIKGSSLRRGRIIPFDISIEQVWELFLKQNRKCALSGVEIKFSMKNPRYEGAKENTASLDRIDSTKGYTIDNVQWVHKEVNLMKMNLPQDVFFNWCKIITEHLMLQPFILGHVGKVGKMMQTLV